MLDTAQPIRVACCQVRPRFGDVGWNRAMIREAIHGAVAKGARLAVLPELCTTGYAFESAAEACRLAQPATGGALDDWIEEASAADAVVVGGFAEIDDEGAVYNSAAVVDASNVLAVYRKTHLWDAEREIFAAGSEPPPVVDTRIGRVGVVVCYDLFFPELTRSLALGGTEILVVPTNSPRADATSEAGENIGVSIARAAAHVNRVFVAVCDRWGDERGQRWVGRSVIVDPDGELIAGPPGDREFTVLANCELTEARDKRWTGTSNDAFGDRRPDIYHPEFTPILSGFPPGMEHGKHMEGLS